MRTLSTQELATLQRQPENIRNICILAHVDHGKTTLADALIASNGIISHRLAGKVRYMDSRPDEQARGITMKSSAISLSFTKDEQNYLINLIDSPGHVDFSSEVSTAVRLCDGAIVVVDVVEGVCPQTKVVLRQAWLERIKPVLVLNKIDRLITEVKLSPLEAHRHLQQILEDVNAVTGELFMSDVHEQRATGGATANSEQTMRQATQREVQNDERDEQVYDWSTGLEETDDSHLYFSPDQGNVIFASAIDGWGFGVEQFAVLYARKLGVREDVLRRTLWGDYYLNSKTRRVCRGALARGRMPLFVRCVLANVWAVYEAVLDGEEKDAAGRIARALGASVPARDARHADPRVRLRAVFAAWLPLARAALTVVVTRLPSPRQVGTERVEHLLCAHGERLDSTPAATQALRDDFLRCGSGDDTPTIVYVSKMFAVERAALAEFKQCPLTAEEIAERHTVARQRHTERLRARAEDAACGSDEGAMVNGSAGEDGTASAVTLATDEEPALTETAATDENVFLAFARVFSGTVRPGQKLYVLGPKHNPRTALEHMEIMPGENIHNLASDKHITVCTIGQLYLLMGKELERLDEVPAGNVLGIGGLADHVLKSATISSTVACPAFTDTYMSASAILRVALEPKHASEMPQLVRGMRLLNQADPCVQVVAQETGENILVTAGEMHLQRCLDDLRERFSKIELDVSPPIVPFRETIVAEPKVDMVNEVIDDVTKKPARRVNYDGDEEAATAEEAREPWVEVKTRNGLITMKIQAVPLPEQVTKILERNTENLKTLVDCTAVKGEAAGGLETLSSERLHTLRELRDKLRQAFTSAADDDASLWEGANDKLWAFGPRRTGTNVLLNAIPGYRQPSVWRGLDDDQQAAPAEGVLAACDSIQQGALGMLATCDSSQQGALGVLATCDSSQQGALGVLAACDSSVVSGFQQGALGVLATCDSSVVSGGQQGALGVLAACDSSVVSGFQLATLAGPMCEEPITGVCFVLRDWTLRAPPPPARLPRRRRRGDGERATPRADWAKREGATELVDGTDGEIQEGATVPVDGETQEGTTVPDDGVDGETQEGATVPVDGVDGETQEGATVPDDGVDGETQEGATVPDDGVDGETQEGATVPVDVVDGETQEGATVPGSSVARTSSDEERDDDGAGGGATAGGRDEAVRETRSRGGHRRQRGGGQRASDLDLLLQDRQYGPISGQLMSAMKEGCRKAFQMQPQRLMIAMYSSVIQATAEVLGRVYAVLSRRHGRVLSEDMREGSQVFSIHAVLPVAESFGFTEEMRKRTSGLAMPQLMFSHWEVMDTDPFWVPTTEEEYLLYGEKADSENLARKFMNGVRRRKGLSVQEKIIQHAEKQRTLGRNK